MSFDDRDDRLGDVLRRALTDSAEQVRPAGDGLARIQHRIARRRARMRWLRPVLVVGTTLAVGGAGAGAWALVGAGTQTLQSTPAPLQGHPSTATAAPSPSASSSPSGQVTPVTQERFPARAIYPFTSPAQLRDLVRQQGVLPDWMGRADSTALQWVQRVLGQSSVDRVVSTTQSPNRVAHVVLGRVLSGGQQRVWPVTTVDLAQYANTWIVVGAHDGQRLLRLASPRPGSTVTSPVTVTGPGYGVDVATDVQVRDATTATQYGHEVTSYGNGVAQWSVSVPFSTPTAPTGVVVAVESSNADGGPARIAAEPVRFTGTGAPVTAAAPTYFYAPKDGRIAQFHSSDGSAVRYVTPAQPGGGASDPHVSADGSTLWWLQGAGTCANALLTSAADGSGTPHTVATPDGGYVITGYAILPGDGVTWYENACAGGTSPQARLVSVDASGRRHVIAFPALPPAVVGDPAGGAAAGSGPFVDAIVDSGHVHTLTRYDVFSDTSPTPDRPACAGYDVNQGEPDAIDRVTTATWFATRTGQSLQVWECDTAPHLAFTIDGNRQPGDLSVAPSGAVLVTDTDGHVWRWNGGGAPVQLSPSTPLTQLAW